MDDSELTNPLDADEVQKLSLGLSGRVIGGQFRLLSRLGQGGMGTVWLADQVDIDRPVVVKLMLESARARNPIGIERFRREAKAVAALNHPNIVQIFVFGQTDEGVPYLVMEHVAGPTLRAVLAAGPLPEARTIRIAAQIAEALAEAHHAGIVHRDLKPENVMIADRPGRHDLVKVLDFGIAKMVGRDAEPALTQVGAVFGTPKYMSPEQARGLPADPRSDIYALGVLLHEMITGEHPFDATDASEFMTRHVTETVKAPSARYPGLDLSRDLERVMLRCLEKVPERRFASATALHDALVACGVTTGARTIASPTAPSPVARRRWPGWLVALLVIAGVAVAAGLRLFATPEAAPPLSSSPVVTSNARVEAGGAITPSAVVTSSSETAVSRSAVSESAVSVAVVQAVPRRAASERRLRRRRFDPGATLVGAHAPSDGNHSSPEAAALAGALGLGLGGDPDDGADDVDAQADLVERRAVNVVGALVGSALTDSPKAGAMPEVMPGATVKIRSGQVVVYETVAPLAQVIAWYDQRWGTKGLSRLADEWEGSPRLIIAAPMSPAVGFMSLAVMRSPYDPARKRTAIIITMK